MDMVFPIFTFLQFFFYMGWLKVRHPSTEGERLREKMREATFDIYLMRVNITVGYHRCPVMSMKQISEIEKKLFMSSLNICPEACCRKGWGRATTPFPPTSLYFPDFWILHSKTT